ncbi:hypothetical protein Pyn_08414 [Prunus yedoensis var. nudiflora]|uniref:Uncharacterized protein n=1 Tax=Prunus yedoensis var. nudiflora TaxID=2094558 RepID=A0A314XKT5_PRUYE|nr:hypothetical protein Pyn_08414 [Prunus yedoensis var. nudiflora]
MSLLIDEEVTVLFACIENVSTAFSFNYHERLLELVMCISLAAIEQQISGYSDWTANLSLI